MKAGYIDRSWMEQLILDGTTWENLYYSLSLSLFFLKLPLHLALWPGLERWVDEVFNFFEILWGTSNHACLPWIKQELRAELRECKGSYCFPTV